jgi:4-amino-4-deoxy-L-arabinose transferase-like glycosyltransferase
VLDVSRLSQAAERGADEAAALRHARLAGALIAALVVARLLGAGLLPLASDEAYYWLWSRHLSFGYYDHPPLIALVIRLGTMLAGDTELGVRLVGIALSVPATWAVWRAAAILFRDARLAADAALYFNLSLIVSVGTLLATIDAPLVAASAFVLYFLAKLVDTGRGAWWLAVGAAMGLALLAKYSALFLGVGIAGWLVCVPDARRWLRTPWPYAGAAVALALFAPVVVWNAQHEWASFLKQFGRTAVRGWEPLKLLEYLFTQAGVATPSIFVLGVAGLVACVRGKTRPPPLLVALVLPMGAYFAWHALHTRVQGNWTAPVVPAMALVAAFAAWRLAWQGWAGDMLRWSRILAVPLGVAVTVLIYLHALFGIVPLGKADPVPRLLGVGWRALAAEVETTRAAVGAQTILAGDYATTAWLTFYLPAHPDVIQITQRFRWVHLPEPDPARFIGPLLIVYREDYSALDYDRARFATFEVLKTVARGRSGAPAETYMLVRAQGPKGDALDRTPPPERQSSRD